MVWQEPPGKEAGVSFVNASVASYNWPSIGYHVADMSYPSHPYLDLTVQLRDAIGSLPKPQSGCLSGQDSAPPPHGPRIFFGQQAQSRITRNLGVLCEIVDEFSPAAWRYWMDGGSSLNDSVNVQTGSQAALGHPG
jgi:hypothetical protein